jgi:hypothetical protein
MKRGIIFSLLIVFLLLATTKIAFASFGLSLFPQFGGRIIYPKAIEIQALEAAGFQCIVLGSTFSIMPIGSPIGTPVSYFIPAGIFSKTRNSVRAGQLIMGKYSFKTMIECILPAEPPVIVTVPLDTVTIFGNSR